MACGPSPQGSSPWTSLAKVPHLITHDPPSLAKKSFPCARVRCVPRRELSPDRRGHSGRAVVGDEVEVLTTRGPGRVALGRKSADFRLQNRLLLSSTRRSTGDASAWAPCDGIVVHLSLVATRT